MLSGNELDYLSTPWWEVSVIWNLLDFAILWLKNLAFIPVVAKFGEILVSRVRLYGVQ